MTTSKRNPIASGRKATIYLPSSLDADLERWRRSQPVPPNRSDVIQAALRAWLDEQRRKEGRR